jgi:hypothetical protein
MTHPAKPNSVTFRATIPPKAAAIDFHGECGARLILDIPDSELGGFTPIIMLRCKRLLVTIAEDV